MGFPPYSSLLTGEALPSIADSALFIVRACPDLQVLIELPLSRPAGGQPVRTDPGPAAAKIEQPDDAGFCSPRSRKVRGVSRDDAYTFGLFRDCAVPLMMSKFPGYYEMHAAASRAPDKSVAEVEQEIYAVDHTRVGWHLANSWELPEGTCQAILHHHDYARVFADDIEEVPRHAVKLIAVALVAAQLFRSLSAGTACPEWKKAGTRALEVLGTSDADLKTAAVEVARLS